MATKGELKSVTSNQKILKGSEGGSVGQSEQVKMGNQGLINQEKKLMNDVVDKTMTWKGYKNITDTIKALRWARGK